MRITRNTKFLTSSQFFELYARFIKESSKGKRLKKDGSRIRLATIENYLYTQKLINDFIEKTGFELQVPVVSNLTNKEKENAKKYYKKFFKEFCDYLYFEKDFFDNYVGLLIKGLKTFYNYLNAELNISVGDFHKSFYIPSEEVPIVVLSPEQLNYLIHDQELNQKLPEHLKQAKDIFVFGCTVALRFSDLISLTRENLHFYNGAYYLKVTSIKTDTHTTIKLPEYCIKILQKYEGRKHLLPIKSISWLNICLKELGRHLNFEGSFIKQRTKRGVKYPVYKNKAKRQHYTLADHISSHTMRRTAITNMLRLGMPEQVVRKISGHSANSREFFRYVEFAQGYIDEHTDKMYEKMNSLPALKG